MKKVLLINLLLKEMSLRGCVDQKITLMDKSGVEKIWRIPRLDVITPSKVVAKEVYDDEDKLIVANQLSRLDIYKLEKPVLFTSNGFSDTELFTLDQLLITLKCHLLMCAKDALDSGKNYSGELSCYDIGGSSEHFDKITTSTHSSHSLNDLKKVTFEAKFSGKDVRAQFTFDDRLQKFKLTSASLDKSYFSNKECDREWLFLNLRTIIVAITESFKSAR